MAAGTGSGTRGVSTAVGYALLLAITVVTVTAVVAVGGAVLTDLERSAETGRAVNAMSQLDARATTVSLGTSPVKRVTLEGSGESRVTVDPDAGHVRLLVVNDSGTRTIVDERFGAVVYDLGETTVAYQGGGVWRTQAGSTTVVSTPEYHYREQTLTFPIVRVTGEPTSGSPDALAVRRAGTDELYPTGSATNPLTDGHVVVEVTSDYHEGWKRYFESKTEGAVSHDPANRTVSVNLTVPVTEAFDDAVAATASGSSAIDDGSTSPHGGFDSPTETGVDRPAADRLVDEAIADCSGGGCPDLLTEAADGRLENGTYYAGGSVDPGDVEFDTSEGDVRVVVDGDLTLDGNDAFTVTGDNRTRFYVRGDVDFGGTANVNTGGDPAQFITLVHSAGDSVTVRGNAQYTGLLYAPDSSFAVNGGGPPSLDNVVGAVVVEDATANGNGNLRYERPVGTEIEFETPTDVTYLHVTENRVDVTEG